MTLSFWGLLSGYEVEIPIMQRDYAQGRQMGKVPAIRQRFLQELCTALEHGNEKPFELDFVYGYIQNIDGNGQKRFIPLDGQQRLTTLFLLHWYIGVREHSLEPETSQLLGKFTYETRYSSREFCKRLVRFRPLDLTSSVGSTIENQPWFFTAWKNDPTIRSMLVMLDDIQKMVDSHQLQNVWPLLIADRPPIVFHLLSMKDLGLPDELYIKMNSRGKELTEFEYFKSRFSELLSGERLEAFNLKVDQQWSDLFLMIFKDENSRDIAQQVDSGFLKFFRFLTDMLVYRKGINVEGLIDAFGIFERVYSSEDNIDFTFRCLDILSETLDSNPSLFSTLFYVADEDFSVSKTRLFFQNRKIDLFRKCADSYDTSSQNNPFSIGEQLLFFACILHLMEKTADFPIRLRKLRNLVANSEDTLRKENMSSLLVTVERIVLDDDIGHSQHVNPRQVEEEKKKQLFLANNNSLTEAIFRLEDHHLLQGCLAIFELEDGIDSYADLFRLIFHRDCNYDSISRAMLSFGDYSQQYSWRRRFGNRNDSVWRELFTPSQRRGDFQNTKSALYKLFGHVLQYPMSSSDDIVAKYLANFDLEHQAPKDWRYYYIKYPGFRTNDDGYYHWQDPDKPYDCIMMRRSTFNGFNWSPFLYIIKQRFPDDIYLDNYSYGVPRIGAPLVLTIGSSSVEVFHNNAGYKIEIAGTSDPGLFDQIHQLCNLNSEGVFAISQNQNGVDLEDRVEKGIELVSKLLALKPLTR